MPKPKGTRACTDEYLKVFHENNLNGRKLMLLDISDLDSLLKTNLNNQLIAFNSIQNLIQFVSFYVGSFILTPYNKKMNQF